MVQITRLGIYGYSARPYAGFSPAAANAVISGTITAALESDIVAGGQTIIITVANDTWVASGAAFNAIRQDIIDGLDSAGAEATGWNAEVRDKEVVGAVVRTSNTVVTITLTAAPAYAVTADETITVTVPATALAGGLALTAAPTFAITAEAETTAVRGGGYLTADEIERLAKLAQKAVKTRQRDWKLAKTTQAARLAELRQVYDRVQGLVVSTPETEEIAEAVRPYAPKQPTNRVPQAQMVDFTSLLNSARATARLADALTKLRVERADDEETMILLMMAAV